MLDGSSHCRSSIANNTGPLSARSFDHRQERGRDRALIGHGAVVRPQQHLVDGELCGPGRSAQVAASTSSSMSARAVYASTDSAAAARGGQDPEAAGLCLLDRS